MNKDELLRTLAREATDYLHAVEVLFNVQPEGDCLAERKPTKDESCYRAFIYLNDQGKLLREAITAALRAQPAAPAEPPRKPRCPGWIPGSPADSKGPNTPPRGCFNAPGHEGRCFDGMNYFTPRQWDNPNAASAAPVGPVVGWSVTVEQCGQSILSLSDQHQAGVSRPDKRVIRRAAEHLLAFIGDAPAVAAAPAVDPALVQGAEKAIRWLDGENEEPPHVAELLRDLLNAVRKTND